MPLAAPPHRRLSLSIRPITVAVHPDESPPVEAPWLAGAADRALDALSLPADASVEVVITDDETVRELNRRHRGLDETTDVLSFASAGGGGDGFVLPPERGAAGSIGEVVVSWPQASRQATAGGRDPSDEVAFLVAHGILHLVGHDHEEPAERGEMEAEHRRLLRAMLGPRASAMEVRYPA